MAKEKKPYNVKTNSKKNTTRRKRVDETKKKLESTTRIRIDKERLNDIDSLDTSFLEGRVDAQNKKKVLNSKAKKEKSFDFTILRNVIGVAILIVLLILVVLALMNHSSDGNKKVRIKKVTEEKIVEVVDDNYLFVGDFHTNELNFDELDYHYTKLVDDSCVTEDILNGIDTIYRYNPSIVFIELGINDLDSNTESVDTITNLSEIIDGIKENRKSAKIYVESIYPINTDMEEFNSDSLNESVTNDRIVELNKLIKELCDDKKVEYIDVNKELLDDDKLNEEYTDDGLHLNDEGKEKVWNLLKKVVDKNGNKTN